jgi:hypothetical protein
MKNEKEADAELLISTFKSRLTAWTREDLAQDKILRFAQAYLMMARAKYRPAAPSDGFGNIHLDDEEYNDEARLYREAVDYALHFNNEEDSDVFHIGCSNWGTNRAFILSIEAARLLASGSDGDEYALRLLRLAIKEIADANNRRKKRDAR